MASASRRENTPLIDRLRDEAPRFDFFQAVRILERFYRKRAEDDTAETRQPVGVDNLPDREVVRFRSTPSFTFPASSIVEIKAGADDKLPWQMLISFMGLTGPSAVLPDHYTRLLCDRRQDDDDALYDFFDLFHHRLVSLFYRAGQKYKVAPSYERSKLVKGEDDWLTYSLYCQIGVCGEAMFQRLLVPRDALLYYAGFLADNLPSAIGLTGLLTDYFGFDCRTYQFHGRWLRFNDDEMTRLPSRQRPQGDYARLGDDFVAGTRSWDTQGKFALRIGPVGYEQFYELLPIGRDCPKLVQLTRIYVGVEHDFDLFLVLRAEEVPGWELRSEAPRPGRLGWNTWLAGDRRENDEFVMISVELLEDGDYVVADRPAA